MSARLEVAPGATALNPRPGNEPAPFFLVGSVRSGTTLLRLLLGHHPEICRCDEFEFVAPWIAGRADWPDAATYRQHVEQRRDFRASGLQMDPALSFPEQARDFLRQRQKADGRPVIGATVHNHYDELPRLWPSAKYIFLVRDPRDVARSCVQMGWAGNAWAAARIWRTAFETWRRLRLTLPADRFVELSFERLMADVEGELDRVSRFLGASFDPAMLDLERDTTYKRPNPRGSKSWRTDAPERDVREVEAELGPLLLEAGYEPSGLPPLKIGPLRRAAMTLEHRFGRMRFGQRRYGMGLWLAAALARRLPLHGMRQRLRREFEKINQRHLQ